MNLKALVGAGHQIMLVTLVFAAMCIVLEVLNPGLFNMNAGTAGTYLGWMLLLMGVPIWLTSAVQVLINVPRGKLITTGPYRFVMHPLYTSVGLLVLPGIGFLAHSWMWLTLGFELYASSRIYSKQEEKALEEMFSDEYRDYRAKVLLPWV